MRNFTHKEAADILAACGVMVNNRRINRVLFIDWLRSENITKGFETSPDGVIYKPRNLDHPFPKYRKYFTVTARNVYINESGLYWIAHKMNILKEVKEHFAIETMA